MSNHSEITFPALQVKQPIGDFFIAVLSAKSLVEISVADVRRLHDHPIDDYIGIQRRLSPKRSQELKRYVNSYDATFPTSVILAVREENAEWDDETKMLTLRESGNVKLSEVASILDGQHRVDGLTAFEGEDFEINVSIFIGADVGTQASIFATVNLAQTKVNRSLAYDLLDYEKSKSPQKSAHHIAIALDQLEYSPFHMRIKRLGGATEGRSGETITQAALVESLLDLTSKDPVTDRNSFMRRFKISLPSSEEHKRYPFRQMFLKDEESKVTQILLNYFIAVRERWPDSWDDLDRKGNVLPKTNGLKALMRFLRLVYLDISGDRRDYVPNKSEFRNYLDRVQLGDSDFDTAIFVPGTSGEALLFRKLSAALEPNEVGDQETLI